MSPNDVGNCEQRGNEFCFVGEKIEKTDFNMQRQNSCSSDKKQNYMTHPHLKEFLFVFDNALIYIPENEAYVNVLFLSSLS